MVHEILIPRKTKKYGWIPDLPDQRDVAYTIPVRTTPLPATVDMRSLCPPVYNQGDLGSCTANATAGMVQFERMLQQLTPNFIPSRLFIYYGERVLQNTVSTDSGASVRDGIKVTAALGAPPETDWPYDIAKFTDKPPAKAYTDALTDKAVKYNSLAQTLAAMQACLASGHPFIYGFTVYESFESNAVTKTGVVPMPAKDEEVLGGHCVMTVGYDNPSQRFICRNSWGTDWGQVGYFTIPYAYLESKSLSSGFWTITLMS